MARDPMADDAQGRAAFRAARAALRLTRFDWSAARIELLRQRWAEGECASRIAKELGPGVSRCAVLGKIHRLKLVRPDFKRQHRRKGRAGKRPGAPGPARAKRTVRAPSALMAAFRALGLEAPFGAPDTRAEHRHAGKAFGSPCGLLELTAATCRWPVGEPGAADFVFCGAAPFQRYPYCIAHCLIAYRPETLDGAQQRPGEPARHDHRGLDRAA